MSLRRHPRTIVFTVVTVLAGLLYGYAATLLPVPWTGTAEVRPGVTPADLHWDLALMGAATGLMLGSLLLILAWRPLTKPLLIQTVAVTVVLVASLQVPFRGPGYLLIALPAAVVVAVYPRLHSLTEVHPRQRLGRPFVLLGVATGLTLLVRVAVAGWHQADLSGSGPAADLGWIDDATHTVFIAVGALLTVTGRPGWRILGAVVGTGLCYLGAVSATLPEARGSWGVAWGAVAGVAGLLYLAGAVRHSPPPPDRHRVPAVPPPSVKNTR